MYSLHTDYLQPHLQEEVEKQQHKTAVIRGIKCRPPNQLSEGQDRLRSTVDNHNSRCQSHAGPRHTIIITTIRTQLLLSQRHLLYEVVFDVIRIFSCVSACSKSSSEVLSRTQREEPKQGVMKERERVRSSSRKGKYVKPILAHVRFAPTVNLPPI